MHGHPVGYNRKRGCINPEKPRILHRQRPHTKFSPSASTCPICFVSRRDSRISIRNKHSSSSFLLSFLLPWLIYTYTDILSLSLSQRLHSCTPRNYNFGRIYDTVERILVLEAIHHFRRCTRAQWRSNYFVFPYSSTGRRRKGKGVSGYEWSIDPEGVSLWTLLTVP